MAAETKKPLAVAAGDRVGAVLSSTSKEVRFLGWGVYDGLHPKPGVVVPTFEEMLADEKVMKPPGLSDDQLRERYDALMAGPMADMLYKSPRITLDNGKVVWGSECWWGAEKSVRAHLRGKAFVLVDIDVARGDAAAFKAMVAEQKAKVVNE